jgi:hypothetical protein
VHIFSAHDKKMVAYEEKLSSRLLGRSGGGGFAIPRNTGSSSHNNSRFYARSKKMVLIGLMVSIVILCERLQNETNKSTITNNHKANSRRQQEDIDMEKNIKLSFEHGNYIPITDDDWSCIWSPSDQAKCDEVFHNRLPPPKVQPLSDADRDAEKSPIDSQRWIFLGDSTMKRLFDRSILKSVLVEEPALTSRDGCLGPVSCEEREADRCELNDAFGLPYAEEWIPPEPLTFSGPIKFGSMNPFCTDCSGCSLQFLECRSLESVRNSHLLLDENDGMISTADIEKLSSPKNCDSARRARRYGGFIPMEFARDAEIQTPEYRTTQENVGAYIGRVWNTPELLQDWGKPICVIGAGNHDVAVVGITLDSFVENARFMLTSMMDACEHMIWLGNTANVNETLHPEFKQTKQTMQIWDRAVKEMIVKEPSLHRMMSYIDVIDAAYNFPHADHIHMHNCWYEKLGDWFHSLLLL